MLLKEMMDACLLEDKKVIHPNGTDLWTMDNSTETSFVNISVGLPRGSDPGFSVSSYSVEDMVDNFDDDSFSNYVVIENEIIGFQFSDRR